MSREPTPPTSRAQRVTELLDRALAVRSRRAPGVAYAAAALLFVTMVVIGFSRLPAPTDDAQPLLLLIVALVLGPLTSACNAGEYVVTARYAGVRVGLLDALGIATLSTAANLLPLPGAAVVRTSALRRRGVGYSRAASSIVATSGAWLAVTALLSGVLLLMTERTRTAGSALVVIGVAGVVAAHLLAGAHRRPGGVSLSAALVAVELAKVAVGAARLLLCTQALGYDVDVVQVVVLMFAPILASAVGAFPGGLGLREALAASIGPLVALPAAVAAAGTAVDRLLGLPVVLLVAGRFAAAASDRGDDVAPAGPERPPRVAA